MMSLQLSRPVCSSRDYRPSRTGLIAFVILIAITLIYLVEINFFLSSVTSQVLNTGATVYNGLPDSAGNTNDTHDTKIDPINITEETHIDRASQQNEPKPVKANMSIPTEVHSNKCEFCDDTAGVFDLNLLVPRTNGNTCGSIKSMASGVSNGSDMCAVLQKEESVCCPNLNSTRLHNDSVTIVNSTVETSSAATTLQVSAIDDPPASLAHVQQQTATEQQKMAGKNQIQLSHWTAMDRYPDEYSAVQNYFQTLVSEGHPSSSATKKILSFGASTGEEAITLASMYFGNSTFTIFGVDLDEESLVKANASAVAHLPTFDDGKITFFNGKSTDISVHGPYDAIFANSVLCYHDHGQDLGYSNPISILARFPFSAFEDTLDYLDTNLNVGGVLAIVNTNYHISDTQLHKRYKTLARCKNIVPKVDAKSATYEENLNGRMYDCDCVWRKEKNNKT